MKFFAAICSIFAVISTFGQTAPDFTKVKAIINDYVSHKKFPSISIAVVREGKIIWEDGFGYADIENKRKVLLHFAPEHVKKIYQDAHPKEPDCFQFWPFTGYFELVYTHIIF
jgi:hypothetical protein